MDSPKSDTDEDVRRLSKLLEESMQEAHEMRSRLQITEKCVRDYEAELEALQQDAFEKDQTHASAIREIEEEKANALKEAEERILNWQMEYQAISEKLASVQKELEEKSVNTESLTKEKNETAALYNELQETMNALTMSTAACHQNKELISVLQTEKRELVQHVEMLEENLQCYKENLSIVKAQLSAQTEQFKEIQELLAVTQSDLAALKATPDVKSRGNSLFAEVEDNRQQMAKDYKLMLAKFGYMKKDYSIKCSEIAKLKKENARLIDKLDVAERVAKKHYKAFVENYEIRIKELQMTINQLKNDVKPVYLNGNENILKFAEQTVVNSRREIKSLRDEMEMRSALRLTEAAELLKTRGELAQAHADLRKSSLKIAELTAALNERGIQPALSTTVSETSPEEKPSVTTEVRKTNAVAQLCTTAPQIPNEVVFKEELLHDKFNSRKRDVKIDVVIREDPCIKEVKECETVDDMVTAINASTIKVEVADDSLPGRVQRIEGMNGVENDKEIKAGETLDMDGRELDSFSLERKCEPEEQLKNVENSTGEESSIRSQASVDEIHLQVQDDLTATRQNCSSGYLEPEDEMKIESMLDVNFSSPLPLGEKTNINERALKPDSKRRSDHLTRNIILTSIDSHAETRSFDFAKCEEIPSSILTARSNCSFENIVKNVGEEVKENVWSDIRSSGIKQEKEDETNKENSAAGGADDNVREENQPTRRRPRPKQTHPTIYIT